MNSVNCNNQTENNLNVNNIRLKDLIDIDILQCFQDNFSKGVGLASITVDLDGTPVTQPSNYTKFCMDYMHSTKCGDRRCAESHRRGGEQATRLGKPYIYKCHAGLIDFAAPIIVKGFQVGTILGGQVLTDAPEEFKYRQLAREIGVNEAGYVDAVKEISLLSRERIEAAANVLSIVANYMSKTTYHQHILKARSNLLSNSLSQISLSVHELASLSNMNHTLTDINPSTCSTNTITGHSNDLLDLIRNLEHAFSEQQKEMARLDRLNLIGEMAASIGHEVRNPLTTVRGFLQFFSKKPYFKDYVQTFGTMIEELDRANGIITEFLSLAKNRKVDLKMMDLNEIIKKLMPLLQANAMLKNIPLKFNLGTISLLPLDENEISPNVLFFPCKFSQLAD